jgi:putative oligomerization/nucleic acid binding protein
LLTPREAVYRGLFKVLVIPAAAPLLIGPRMFLSQQPRGIFPHKDRPMIAIIVLLSLILIVELVIAAALLYHATRSYLRPRRRPGEPPLTSPLEEQLLQLNRLRDQGVLSPEEYQQKRADILRRV